MRFEVFCTPTSRAVEHPAGWAPISNGLEVTRLPLLDSQCGVFARLRYRDAATVAKNMHAELLTTAIADEIQRTGYQIPPVIIRETTEEQAERLARGGTDPLERMATIEWARREDLGILGHLAKWNQDLPVAGAGKDWIRGAASGRALNYGWDTDPGPGIHYIQTLGTRHDESHTDYSQLTRLVRVRKPQ